MLDKSFVRNFKKEIDSGNLDPSKYENSGILSLSIETCSHGTIHEKLSIIQGSDTIILGMIEIAIDKLKKQRKELKESFKKRQKENSKNVTVEKILSSLDSDSKKEILKASIDKLNQDSSSDRIKKKLKDDSLQNLKNEIPGFDTLDENTIKTIESKHDIMFDHIIKGEFDKADEAKKDIEAYINSGFGNFSSDTENDLKNLF